MALNKTYFTTPLAWRDILISTKQQILSSLKLLMILANTIHFNTAKGTVARDMYYRKTVLFEL